MAECGKPIRFPLPGTAHASLACNREPHDEYDGPHECKGGLPDGTVFVLRWCAPPVAAMQADQTTGDHA